MKNYVIWGIAPDSNDEQILLEKVQGEYITSVFNAIKIQGILERKHNCTNCRIQEIELNDASEINKLIVKSINI